jgi:hypothetical protein
MQVARNGFEIIEKLSVLVSKNREYLRHKKFYDERGGPTFFFEPMEGLRLSLGAQYLALENLLRTYRELDSLVSIAEASSEEPNSFFLYRLLADKAASMSWSAEIGKASSEPLGPAGLLLSYELQEAKQKLDADSSSCPNALSKLVGQEHEPDGEELALLIERRLKITTLPWDETVNKLVEYYIDSGLAKKRLEDIVSSASKFRTAFQKAFSIEDVLLASERRLRSKSLHKA